MAAITNLRPTATAPHPAYRVTEAQATPTLGISKLNKHLDPGIASERTVKRVSLSLSPILSSPHISRDSLPLLPPHLRHPLVASSPSSYNVQQPSRIANMSVPESEYLSPIWRDDIFS